MKKVALFALACLLLLCPAAALANAAAPPSIVLIVPHPPADLHISFALDGETFHLQESARGWERYYALYHIGMPLEGDVLVTATTNGSMAVYTIAQGERRAYNSTFTLALANGQLPDALLPGEAPGRDALLVVLRVSLTLLLEGLVLFLLRFREKRTWLVFLCLNLLTQGVLNILLADLTPHSSYPMFSLLIGEFFVFLTEGIAFPLLAKEKTAGKRLLASLLANLVSLVLGGFLITMLPV